MYEQSKNKHELDPGMLETPVVYSLYNYHCFNEQRTRMEYTVATDKACNSLYF